MFKKILTFAVAGFLCISANAEVKGFINPSLGIADTDWNTNVYLSIFGGVQFNEYVELEIGYNNYGDVGPFDVEITSFSYGLNFGGPVSESVRLFLMVGAERLEADDTVSLGVITVNVDEESTETYVGVGASFQQTENVAIRANLISHDSGDLRTLNVGVVLSF